MTECPWDDEAFTLPIDAPCPVCGATGEDIHVVAERCGTWTAEATAIHALKIEESK